MDPELQRAIRSLAVVTRRTGASIVDAGVRREIAERVATLSVRDRVAYETLTGRRDDEADAAE